MKTGGVQSHPLYEDLLPIVQAENSGLFEYTLTLHTPGDELKALGVVSIDILSDYEQGFTQMIQAKLVFPLGDFVYYIYPFRDLLEAVLTVGITERRYRVILPQNVLQYAASLYQNTDIETLNEGTSETINIQLVDLHAEPSRLVTCRGVYKGNVETIIKEVMKTGLKQLTVQGKPGAYDVKMTPPDNQKVYEQLIIPTGTDVMDLVPYIQKEYGIYSRGVGRFLTYEEGLPVWSIYDLYNPLRYKTEQSKIRCFIVPPNIDMPMTSTWDIENDVFSFIATTDVNESQTLDRRRANRTFGFSYTDAGRMIDDDVNVEKGVPYGSADHSYKKVIFTGRDDLLNQTSNKGITNNPYELASSVSSNYLGFKQVLWSGMYPYRMGPGQTLVLYEADISGAIYKYSCSILKTKAVLTQERRGILGNEMSGTMIINLGIMNRIRT